MIDVGRVCVKTAGRDAGKKCVIVDVLDDTYVLIDGQTRRKKVNMLHLEPTKDVVDLPKAATHEEVAMAFKKAGWDVKESKPRKKADRPRPVRGKKEPLQAVTKVLKKRLDEKVTVAAKLKDKPQQVPKEPKKVVKEEP